jgi:hypothetical protein
VVQVPVAGALGVYSANVTGLTASTGYTFKPYVTNGAGTAYGSPFAFFTTFPPLTVTSPTVTDVTATTSTLGGTVVSDGGTTVSERGIVYSTDANVAPVIGGPGVTKIVGSGTMGSFTVGATGLSAGTTYFFRAYAISGSETSYSDVASFETLAVMLLGESQVEWPTVSAPTLQVQSESEGGSTQASTQVIPQFVYLKDPAEALDPLVYQIETSPDAANWQAVDEDNWAVQETSESISATWNSPSNPPARIFFRVSADTQ